MFARRADLFEEGIEDTWRNQSNTARYSTTFLRTERNVRCSRNRRSHDSSGPLLSHNPYHVPVAREEHMLSMSSENTSLVVESDIIPSTSNRGGSQTPSKRLMLPPSRPSTANSWKRKRGSSQSSEVSGVAYALHVPSISPELSDNFLLPGEDPLLKARIVRLERLKTAYEQEQRTKASEVWVETTGCNVDDIQ